MASISRDLFWSILASIQTWNGAVTAVATVFIAAFTVVLALTTNRQARLTRDSINLARDEFNATHRPRIIMRDPYRDGDKVLYSLVNNGDAPGTIIESRITVEFVPDHEPIKPLLSVGHDDLGRLTFTPGETKYLTYSLHGTDGSFAMLFAGPRRIGNESQNPAFGKVHFAGTIVYIDNSGCQRRSVFRRRWDFDGRFFARLPNPDLEYAD